MALALSQKREGVPELFKLVQAEKVNWTKVLQRASTQPQEAHFVHPQTQFTALHQAVVVAAQESNNNNSKSSSGRTNAMRALLLANPGAATAQCAAHGYTPLAYACLSQNDHAHEVVQLILEISPDSININSNNGKSPLELHMRTMSQKMAHGGAPPNTPSTTTAAITNPGTVTLSKLLASSSSNSTYIVSKELETLFSYNSLFVLEKLALEEAIASLARLQARRQARLKNPSKSKDATHVAAQGSSSSTSNNDNTNNSSFANFWVWQWALVFLEHEHERRFLLDKHKNKEENTVPPPFTPLLVASSIKDCPLPFLIMAVRAARPGDIREADRITGNLALHNVAHWDAQEADKVARKSMALNLLSRENPHATQIKNKQGKTPLSLALETGTSWDNGVRCLTQKKEAVTNSTSSSSSCAPHYYSSNIKKGLHRSKSVRSIRSSSGA